MSQPIVNPREQVIRSVMEREGFVPQRRLTQNDDEQRRFLDDAPRLIVQETFLFFKADLAAATTTTMHTDFRTSSTAVLIQSQSMDVPANARLVLCRVIGSADVTAGTITPQLRVSDDGATDFYLIEECELSVTVPRTKSVRIPWESAIQISAAATWTMQLVADGPFLPNGSVDYVVKAVLAYDAWTS